MDILKDRDCELCLHEHTSVCDDCIDRGFAANWQFDISKLFKQTALDIVQTLSNKNNDYGDSFYEVYAKFGDLSTYIRLRDKLGRMESLISNKEIKVKDEPLEDVYKDIAGYCILTLASKQRLQQGGK